MNKEAVPLEEKKATQPAENEELETKEAPRQAEEETKKAEEAASKPEKKAKKEKSEKADKIGRAEALEKELDGVKRELEALKDQHQRMLAEYANYKRRTEQEKEQIGLFTKAELLRANHLRLPRIAHLMAILRDRDGLDVTPVGTIGAARRELLRLLKQEELL